MRVINLSYNIPRPQFTDPDKWLERIAFSVTVMEAMTRHVEVQAIHHIDYRGTLKRNGVIYHFTALKRWEVLLPFRLHRFVRQQKPDAVIVHGLSPWQIVLLRWQLGKDLRIFVEHHADKPFSDFRAHLQRWADRYVRAYFFGAVELGRQWVEKGQIASLEKIREIIGTSSIFYPANRAEAVVVTKAQGHPVYLWVGGLEPRKDPLLVVGAFAAFVLGIPDATLYMIYQSNELELLVRDFIESRGIANIILVGEVRHSDLIHWYNSADFIISSSRSEGSGIAVLEAMSCGCIPLLTRIPSFEMITNNELIGLLYDAGSLEGLVSVLRTSVQLNISEVSSKVLNWYWQHHSSDAAAQKIIKELID
jgi:glycosyltransferase involved in cell wall biosynthesis